MGDALTRVYRKGVLDGDDFLVAATMTGPEPGRRRA
jgi:hypothetical protein